MANQFSKGHVFVPGEVVDPDDLNNLVDLATALGGIVSEQSLVTPLTTDTILINRAGTLHSAAISALPGAGTVTSVSATIDSGSSVLNFSVSSPTTTPAFHIGLDPQTANKVLAGPTSGTSGVTPGFRPLVLADMVLPAQNVASASIDASLSNLFTKQLPSNSPFTFTFTAGKGSSGQVIKVWVQQFTTGGTATVAWSSPGGVIYWPGGTVPVMTTGAQAIDIFEFVCVGGDTYYGIRWGANFHL